MKMGSQAQIYSFVLKEEIISLVKNSKADSYYSGVFVLGRKIQLNSDYKWKFIAKEEDGNQWEENY